MIRRCVARRVRAVQMTSITGLAFAVGAAPAAHADGIEDAIIDAVSSVGAGAIDQGDLDDFAGVADPGVAGSAMEAAGMVAGAEPAASDVPDVSDVSGSLDASGSDWWQVDVIDPLEQLSQQFTNTLESLYTSVTGQEVTGNAGWLFGDPSSAAASGAGATDTDSGAVAGSAESQSGVPDSASVKLTMESELGTEPTVDVSVGGGQSIPVLVDSGSNGLVIPWYDMGLQQLTLPDGAGFGSYAGGLDYFYVSMPTTVNFGEDVNGTYDVVTKPTDVDVVLFTFPTTIQQFLGGGPEGVLGIAPDAFGPDHGATVTSALPGNLGDGVLINEKAGTLTFGDSSLIGAGGVAVDGTAQANLDVSIDGGPPTTVSSVIDSGGVLGTMPTTAYSGTVATGGSGSDTFGALPTGTNVLVSTSDGTPLYEYNTLGGNAATALVEPPSGLSQLVNELLTGSTTDVPLMNTGNWPFTALPVWISSSSAHPETIFGINSQ